MAELPSPPLGDARLPPCAQNMTGMSVEEMEHREEVADIFGDDREMEELLEFTRGKASDARTHARTN
eukprot:929478-Pleurochrysis_carterae.AAC.2